MPSDARGRALVIGAAVLVVLLFTIDVVASVAFSAFAALAVIAWIPRFSASVLARVGWRYLPIVGRTTGRVASLVLVVLAFGSVVVSPSFRTATPRPDATVVSPATAAPVATLFGNATPGPSACDGRDPRSNVYHPDRLVLLERCATITGTVVLTHQEPDGDWHISVRLDAGQERYLNDGNRRDQGGALVVEIVCANRITQADAVDACRGYTNPISAPRAGVHVAVAGPWVLDTVHGWNEIHPVWSLREDQPASSSQATTGPLPLTPATSPQPATSAGPAVSAPPSAVPAATPVPSTRSGAASTGPVVSAPPSAVPTATPVPSATPGAADWSVQITAARYGFVAATTAAGATCTAQARLPSGRISTAQGLQVTATAGADGSVSWSYQTVWNTTPGTGTYTVTCQWNGVTKSTSGPLTVP